MDISLSRIADMVALHLGEYADRKRRRDSPLIGMPLEDFIEPILELTALKLTIEADLKDFRGGVDFRMNIYQEADFGDDNITEYELPGDFLRLAAFRMSDWPVTLNEDFCGDARRLHLGVQAPGWLQTRSRRPWLIVDRLSEKTASLRFGPTSRRLPAIARYIPRPVYDQEEKFLTNIDPYILAKLPEALVTPVGCLKN